MTWSIGTGALENLKSVIVGVLKRKWDNGKRGFKIIRQSPRARDDCMEAMKRCQ